MNLLATSKQAVETAFSIAKDFVQSSTWKRVTSAPYDPASGTQSTGFSSRTVRAIEDKVSASTASRLELSASAIRLWIPGADFENVPLLSPPDPDVNDKLVHRGKTYTVRDVQFQGAKILWEIHADV